MLHVIKATGEAEPYSEDKLISSIRRAGIPKELQDKVLLHVKEKLYDDIPTSILYHHIKEYLKHSEKPYASARYSLKQSIMDLGPTGYPFEDYISHIMRSQGYETSVRNIVRGKCISHEIDVIATKQDDKIMVEAKFHHFPGTKTNVHVSMYTKARFDDIRDQHHFTHSWLVSNTKITTDAIAYGACYNMRITSWDYPVSNSLRAIIEREQLFPITALLQLSHTQKIQLLEQGIVLVKDLLKNREALHILHIPTHREEDVLAEAQHLIEVD
jgi:hypothetical protein